MNAMRLVIALVFGGIALTGCSFGGPVPLASCTEGGVTASHGPLRVLPSQVPGVSIDTASWGSANDVYEGGTGVYYTARVSSTVTLPLRRFAVQFHSSRPDEDSSLVMRGPSMQRRTQYGGEVRGGTDSIRPGDPRFAFARFRRQGAPPGPWGCPRSAQIVRAFTPLVRIGVVAGDTAAPRTMAFAALVRARLERLGDTSELRVIPQRDVDQDRARGSRQPSTHAELRDLASRLGADVVVEVVALQREPQLTARAVAHFRAFPETDSLFVGRGETDVDVANRLTQRLLDEMIEELRRQLLRAGAVSNDLARPLDQGGSANQSGPSGVTLVSPDFFPKALFDSLGAVTSPSSGNRYRKDILTIDFRIGTPLAVRQAIIDSIGGVVVGGAHYSFGGEGTYYVRIHGGTLDALLDALTILDRQPQVMMAGWWQLNHPDENADRQPDDGLGFESW